MGYNDHQLLRKIPGYVRPSLQDFFPHQAATTLLLSHIVLPQPEKPSGANNQKDGFTSHNYASYIYTVFPKKDGSKSNDRCWSPQRGGRNWTTPFARIIHTGDFGGRSQAASHKAQHSGQTAGMVSRGPERSLRNRLTKITLETSR